MSRRPVGASLLVVVGVASLIASSLAPAFAGGRFCMGRRATVWGGEVIDGTPGPDVIVGSAQPNVIYGKGGDDVICGMGGGDDLRGGDGDDRISGGRGLDLAIFIDSPRGVTVELFRERAVGEGRDTLTSVEQVVGSHHVDRLVGDDGRNLMDGSDGNDVLVGAGGRDVLYGGNGDDVVAGSEGSDRLSGGLGADQLLGQGYDDWLMGGPEDDHLIGGPGTDLADYSFAGAGTGVTVDLAAGSSSGEGDDSLGDVEDVRGTEYQDSITGDGEPNRLFGGPGPDEISGLGGDDLLVTEQCCQEGVFVLDGGAGADALIAAGAGSLSGGDGDDTLTSDTRGATLDGGPGADTADYRRVSGRDMPVYAEPPLDVEIDLLLGFARARECPDPCPQDTLVGIENATGTDLGYDVLRGDAGPNVLKGGGGDDAISGDDGDDVLYGGGHSLDGDAGDGGPGTDQCLEIERPTACESA